MAIFNNKNSDPNEREEDFKFFSQSDAEYKIPASRKPIVVKKDKTEKKKTSRVVKRAKTVKAATKKASETKKVAEVKTTVKKDVTPKPAAANATKKAAPATEKKTAPKKTAVKKPETKAKTKLAAVSDEGETVAQGKVARVGSFDIKKAKDGRYVFNLYSANKVIIATSQVYSSSQSALTGIKSVMANAVKAEIEDLTLKKPVPKSYPKWEIYLDKADEYRFRLNATNASCICHAKAGYATKSNCKRAIESIIRLAENAQIDKSYIGEKK